ATDALEPFDAFDDEPAPPQYLWREPSPRFVAPPYRPDGGIALAGLPVLLGTMLGGALFLGWTISVIGQVYYPVLVFPPAAGLCLAGLGVLSGQLAQLRNPALGGFIGLCSATTAIAAMHYFDYQRTLDYLHARPQAVPEVLQERLTVDDRFL